MPHLLVGTVKDERSQTFQNLAKAERFAQPEEDCLCNLAKVAWDPRGKQGCDRTWTVSASIGTSS